MSTRSSDSDWEDITSGSEESITPDEEEERGQEGIGVHEGVVGFYGGNELQPYQDEPEADEEWIARYEQELAEELARNMEMEERLDGRREISTWCKCGNCKTNLLQNAKECNCCVEMEACQKALTDAVVLEEAGDLTCITQHPGFKVNCLERWTLRFSSDRYVTKDFRKYKQLGTEQKFLRSVAYRQFTRMVYGKLGKRRKPLPACAYTAIREKFPPDGELTGYEEDSD